METASKIVKYSYTIRRDVRTTDERGKPRWHTAGERVTAEVAEPVAEYLRYDDQLDRRYRWKIDKQRKAGHIREVFSLDEVRTGADGGQYPVADTIEDTVSPSNRDPLAILIEDERLRELKAEYLGTMSRKQYDVFRYHEQGYANTEIAEILHIDESSVRERLHMAFRSAVTRYLIHAHYALFQSVRKELTASYGDNRPSSNTFNRVLGFLFINRLDWHCHYRREMINYVLGEDYNDVLKNYLIFLQRTPETPP
jgi:hypothetical protein